jgi:hypothetical protein
MEQQFRRMQRATVARSALDVIALVFLFSGFAFWSVAFWQLLSPPALLSLLSIQAAVLAIAFSLAAPLLLSMLVPTTPAGQMLQKTQWATVGFYVILAAAIYLVYQAEQLIELWLYAQPAVAEAGFERRLAIVLVISFVIVPALAWVQLTPERWMQQIQQAHQVKKLEMQQAGEIAIIRNNLIWLEEKALIGYVNLLPDEQRALLAGTEGLIKGINDQQRAIARLFGIHADIERDFMGDADIEQAMRQVEQAAGRHTITQIDAPSPAERAPAPYTEPHKAATMARVPGTQGNARDDGEYTIAYERFGAEEAWTVRDLAGVLKVAESTARKTKIAWEDAQLVSGRGLSNGRYRFI